MDGWSPEVVLANGSPAVAAAQQATRTIPIVFVNVVEPVAQGFVQSLAQPGGNITGFTNFEPTMGSKWLELLKKIAPEVTRVAIMLNPDITSGAATLSRSAEVAAPNVGVEAFVAPVHTPAEIETVLTMLGRDPGGGLIVPTGAFTRVHRKLIVELAARLRGGARERGTGELSDWLSAIADLDQQFGRCVRPGRDHWFVCRSATFVGNSR